MTLHEYRRKRDFQRTPEPVAKSAGRGGRSFVIQKHDARNLHYDFRLELDGVLKSWAVPKGPALNPHVKRLAIQVEDHPVDYGEFEGTIPQGEYGGGTVLLWDRGTWEPIGDPYEGFKNGKLKFKLEGKKLRGGWMLVRSSSARGKNDGKQWLLMKERDEDALTESDREVIDTEPLSVLTGRDLAEIAAGKTARRTSRKKSAEPKNSLSTLRANKLTSTVYHPQLATLASEAPAGDEWLHEIKLDGYRIICEIQAGQVRLITSNQLDWTARVPHLAEAAATLRVRNAVLDGELAAVNADGVTDFQALQTAFRDHHDRELVYFAFDLLSLNDRDLRNEPLEKRKARLESLLKKSKDSSAIRYSEHVVGDGPQFFAEAAKLGLEGIISKRRDGRSHAGRRSDWLKIKCTQREEFVIGGYTDPAGSRQGLGALLVGYRNGGAKLHYAGKVGTGFDAKTLQSLQRELSRRAAKKSPFSDLSAAPRGTHWTAPQLVAQIGFSNWTRDGLLRHPTFLGLREDKSAAEVRHRPSAAAHEAQRKDKTSSQANRTAHAKNLPIEVDGVRLTHPERMLYSEDGITKSDLASYYREVAEWMLPHVAERPLVLVRCPDGLAGECFYQKHAGIGTPDILERVPIREKDKLENYVTVTDARGLIALAQISALEIHLWGSHRDKVEAPDRLIFDLDPDESVSWPTVIQTAFLFRRVLEQIGWECFLKTTGGKGLHVVTPIVRRHTWDEAKSFAKFVADAFVAANPKLFLAKASKAARRGKIFIDYLRNDRGSTSVAPYSTRAKPGAPVSVPIGWTELNDKMRSDAFHLRNVPRRLAGLKRDPWEGIAKVRQSIRADSREQLLRAIGGAEVSGG